MRFDVNDILEIKLSGKGQNPKNISSKQALELLKAYEEALIAVVGQKQPEIDLSKLRLSLVDVRESSSRFILLPSVKEALFGAALFISSQVNSGDLTYLPSKSIKNLQEIQRYSINNNCTVHLIKQDKEEIATITPETKIEFPATKFVHGETIIYGKVLRVGGVEPKAFIQLETQKSISIKITEHLAKDLAKRLYNLVGLKGRAKWLIEDYSIQEFKLLDIIEYEKASYKETFKELNDLIGSYWKDIDDVKKALE